MTTGTSRHSYRTTQAPTALDHFVNTPLSALARGDLDDPARSPERAISVVERLHSARREHTLPVLWRHAQACRASAGSVRRLLARCPRDTPRATSRRGLLCAAPLFAGPL